MGSLIILIQRLMFGIVNALRITSIQEELFILGKSFSFEEYFIMAADDVLIFTFNSSAFTGVNLSFNPILFGGSSGPILIDFYTDTDSDDDGTIQGISNRREGFPQPQSILRLGDTINSLGVRFSGDSVPATGLGVGNTNGSSNQPGLPFAIDHEKKHAIVVTNTDGNDTIMQIKMTFFEA